MEEQKGSWVAEEQLKKVEQVIEKEEGVTRKPTVFWKAAITVLAAGTSLFAIYCASVRSQPRYFAECMSR